jgi:hypothetical protein
MSPEGTDDEEVGRGDYSRSFGTGDCRLKAAFRFAVGAAPSGGRFLYANHPVILRRPLGRRGRSVGLKSGDLFAARSSRR